MAMFSAFRTLALFAVFSAVYAQCDYGAIFNPNTHCYQYIDAVPLRVRQFSSSETGNYHNLDKLQSIQHDLVIDYYPHKELQLSKLEEVHRIVINADLESINLPKLKTFIKTGEVMTISGPRIPKDTAGTIRAAVGPNVINCTVADGKEFTEFDDIICNMITGNLILKNTKSAKNTIIRNITGCLQVIDTELDDLSFLDLYATAKPTCAGKSEIKGNKKLCASWGEIKKIEKAFGEPIIYTPDQSCVLPCSEKEFGVVGSTCNELTGELTITDPSPALSDIMKRVKSISGRLIINANDGLDIDFPELETVNGSSQSAETIVINGNNKLKSLKFPKLKSVLSGGKVAIDVKGMDMVKKEAEVLAKAVAAEKKDFKLECSGNKRIGNLDDLDYCTSINGDLLLHKTQGSMNSKIESITGCLQIIDTGLNNLNFLDLSKGTEQCTSVRGVSEVRGNKNLCLKWPEVRDFKTKFGAQIPFSIESQCRNDCTETDFGQVGSTCWLLNGDLTISSPSSSLSELMRKIKKITGRLIINTNDPLDVDFPELETVDASAQSAEAIVINGNNKLKSLKFPKLKTVLTGGAIAIDVKGCDVARDQAEIMAKAADKKGFKRECSVNKKPIGSLDELEYCTSISEDLLLHKTTGSMNSKIESINGCLQIIDTGFKNLEFLDLKSPAKEKCTSVNGSSEVKDNKDLCMEWKNIKDFQTVFGEKISFTIDEKCDLPCTFAEFVDLGSFCRQMTGDAQITGPTEGSVAEIARKVRVIKGFLRIHNTKLENVEFPELLTIIAGQDGGYALEIVENNRLANLSFPMLKSIQTADDKAVLITENDGFRWSDETKTVLQSAANGTEIIYKCHENAEISTFSQLEGCEQMSSSLHLAPSISGNQPASPIQLVEGCVQIYNSQLESLDFLNLTKPSGNACAENNTIQWNSKLCVYPLKARELRHIITTNITIENNKPRDDCPVTCTAFNGSIPDHECNIVEGDLIVQGKCGHDYTLEFVKDIQGTLLISDCSLSSISAVFPLLKNISSQSETPLTFEKIKGSLNVSELRELDLKSTGETLLKIDTEEKIPYMDVADLKFTFGEKKVEVKNVEETPKDTCVFVSPAVSVKNCKKVEGDLVLDEKTKEVEVGAKEITGCLIMKKTVMASYEFLTKVEKTGKCRWWSGETEITENSCIPYNVRRNVAGELQKTLDKGENNKGCNECVGGLKSGEKCHVVIGDLKVDGKATEEMKKQLGEVREVYGRIVVKDTTMESISFTKLEKAETDSKEPAIAIIGNKNLTKLELPSLKNTTSNGKVKVKISENPKLEKTKKLMDTLKAITGTDCKDAKESACHFTEPAKSVAEPDGSGGDGDAKVKEEGGIGTVGIALIVIGVIVLVAIVIGVIAVIVMKRSKSSGGKDKANGMKGKGAKGAKGKGSNETKGKGKTGAKKKGKGPGKKPKTEKTEPSKEDAALASKSKESVLPSAEKAAGTPKENNADANAVPQNAPFNPEDPADAVPPGAEPAAAAAAPAAAGGDDYFGTNAPAAV